MVRNCGDKVGIRVLELLDFDGEALGGGVACGVAGSQRVSGCFGGTYIEAAGIRRPNWAGWRIERDLFRVGYAVAKLSGLAATDLGIAVKRLNGEFGAAHLLDGSTILFLLLLRGGVASPPVDLAIFTPAGKNNPADVDGDEEENSAGVDERIFPDGFFDRRGRSIHVRYSVLAGGFMVWPISRHVIR